MPSSQCHPDIVALRKESVDRNNVNSGKVCAVLVALRKESVDRNLRVSVIEYGTGVALRKESVDRNYFIDNWTWTAGSRSPQGERG